jgi:hypothetical protein
MPGRLSRGRWALAVDPHHLTARDEGASDAADDVGESRQREAPSDRNEAAFGEADEQRR